MPLETTQFTLTPAQAQPIVDESRNYSVIAQLGTQVPIAEAGTTFPVFGQRPTATIVGERQLKPMADFGVNSVHMVKHKFAMKTVLSAEVLREDLKSGLGVGAIEKRNGAGISNFVGRIRSQIGESFGIALDSLALHGSTGASGEAYVDQTTKVVTLGTHTSAQGGVFADLNDVVRQVPKTNAYLLDSTAEYLLNGAVDAAGRPLFVDAPPLTDSNAPFRQGRLLGRRAVVADDIAEDGVIGYAGRWDRLFYGILATPTFKVSDQGAYTDASGNLRSALENNEVIIIAEFEAGVLVYNPEEFVKISGPAGSGSDSGAESGS